MKRLIASLISFSVLIPAASAAPANSVFYYDALREQLRGSTITAAVIDGSINTDIERVHPFDRRDASGSGLTLTELQAQIRHQKVEYNRKKNAQAVQQHCKLALRVTDPSGEGKCGAGFGR